MRFPDPDATVCSSTAQQFLARLLDGDERGAEAVLRRARRRDPSAASLYSTIVKPALRTVGRLWELKEISVADEHMATEITEVVLDRLELPRARHKGPEIMLARSEHDTHALGERAVASTFSAAGWTPVRLGAVDPETLAWAAGARQPLLVALSVKLPQHASDTVAQMRAVKALCGAPPVLVGGEGADLRLKRHGADHVDDDLASALAWAEAQRG